MGSTGKETSGGEAVANGLWRLPPPPLQLPPSQAMTVNTGPAGPCSVHCGAAPPPAASCCERSPSHALSPTTPLPTPPSQERTEPAGMRQRRGVVAPAGRPLPCTPDPARAQPAQPQRRPGQLTPCLPAPVPLCVNADPSRGRALRTFSPRMPFLPSFMVVFSNRVLRSWCLRAAHAGAQRKPRPKAAERLGAS